jgi:hypothetical protein
LKRPQLTGQVSLRQQREELDNSVEDIHSLLRDELQGKKVVAPDYKPHLVDS